MSIPRRPRLALALVFAVGLAVHLPALGAGFYVDDYLHLLALEGRLPMAPWSLYDFGAAGDWVGVPSSVGELPWWTSPDWKVRFFRPLASASLWLDHTLYGRWAPGWTLTGIGLYALMLGAVLRLMRVLGLGRGEAIGALALFAASSSTVLPVGWNANRNALLEGLFTVVAAALAWTASDPRAPRGRRFALAIGVALAAVASKESGVAALVLCGLAPLVRGVRPVPWPRIVLALGLAAAWLGALAGFGFGTHSAFYATPWSQPGAFAVRLFALGPLFALHALGPFSADLPTMAPGFLAPAVAVGALAGAAVLLWGRRRVPGDRATVFLVCWIVLTLGPQAAAPASDRLFFVPMVAGAALLARLIGNARARVGWERRLALALLVSCGHASLMMLLLVRLGGNDMAHEVRESVLTSDVGDSSLGRREIFLLQAENSLTAFSFGATWAAEREDRDLRVHPLHFGRRGLAWRRVDERTFELESLDRPLLVDAFEIVYLTPGAEITGEPVRREGFTVSARIDADGEVRGLRLVLDGPLDPERHRFLAPRDGRLRAIPAPEVGRTTVLEAIVPPHPFVP